MAESWSFEFDGGHGTQEYRAGRAQFCDGPFHGSMEAVEVRPGFILYTIQGVSTHRYVLSPEGVTPRGWIVLGNMLGGAGHIATDGTEEQSWRDQRSFFALTPAMPVSYHIQPQKPWATVGLALAPEVIEDLAGGDELPVSVRAMLDGGGQPFSLMRPLRGSAMTRLAADILDPGNAGGLGALRRQAKCLEYLALMMELLGEASLPGQLSAREATRIREARERLLADLREPPDLYALAHAVGLGVKRLNDGFRMLYGTTVFDYLRDARLDTARKILADGRTPVKQVAWQVGYAHPTNFINAYHRRFGISPARDRRQA